VWRKLILVLVVLPLAVVLIALAVVNRKPALLVLDPLGGTEPGLSLEAPLFLLLLGAFAFGLVVGGIATWIGQGKWRRLAREETRQARDWRRQADRLEKELESTDRGAPRAQLPAE
jgi:lipopolysaccharide assembly LapA-like protein